jgi:hypothetical protein
MEDGFGSRARLAYLRCFDTNNRGDLKGLTQPGQPGPQKKTLFSRLKPAVPRDWLLLLAGVMWSGVGLMLCYVSYGWLSPVGWVLALPLAVIGIGLASAVWHFGFSKIAKKNICRIQRNPDRTCVFAFQAWKSYLIIAVMIILGIALRHTAIPKKYLSIVYTGIGGAMILSSIHYYVEIWGRRGGG